MIHFRCSYGDAMSMQINITFLRYEVDVEVVNNQHNSIQESADIINFILYVHTENGFGEQFNIANHLYWLTSSIAA
jgi:hypothetical protein